MKTLPEQRALVLGAHPYEDMSRGYMVGDFAPNAAKDIEMLLNLLEEMCVILKDEGRCGFSPDEFTMANIAEALIGWEDRARAILASQEPSND